MSLTLIQRLEQNHRLTASGCWLWTRRVDKKGYGRIQVGSRTNGTRKVRRVHCVSWELFHGPIPKDKMLDHRCRNRRCFNPKHLRVTTNRGNTLAPGSKSLPAKWVARTHCEHGHPLSGDNLRIRANGARQCKICAAAYRREWRRRKR